jgi:NADH-quinone oxidoreductase subunit E
MGSRLGVTLLVVGQSSEINMGQKLAEILSRHKAARQELIPILQDTQKAFRYLPETALKEIARFLDITENTVYGVATFYARFKLTPPGNKIIRVCRGTACHVRSAGKVLAEFEKLLEIKAGETTPDREYTLETIACIGACALAPVVTINDEVFARMTPRKVSEILSDRVKIG